MKRRGIILALALALLAAGAAGRVEPAYGPGLSRVAGAHGYEQALALAELRGAPLDNGMPLYAPARPQPMNAYLITDPQCQLGIDGDGMYPVSDAGLIPQITDGLETWMGDIEAASDGQIRFVDDPDAADVLVSACQSYRLYGLYEGEGLSAEGYACTVTLKAVQLTDPANVATFSATREPEQSVVLRGGGAFWKTPPTLADDDGLYDFAGAILGWYGLGAQNGDRGAAVKRVQQSLIDRGFLDDAADGDFGPRTEAAVKRLQAEYGLEESGIVDARTLTAVYYGE